MFQAKGNSSPADCARLLVPLLRDLPEAEVYLEAIEHPEELLETTLALRLDAARSGVWQKNWADLLSGWTVHTGAGADRVTVLATNDWVVVRCLSGGAKDAPDMPLTREGPGARIAHGQRPVEAAKDYWVKADVDLARWSQWFNHKDRKDWPRVEFNLSGRKENVRSQARLIFPAPLGIRPEQWDVPRETIRDPLISFTAIQGVSNWLKSTRFFQELGLDQAPNQLFTWGLSQTAFQIQAAAPMPSPTNALNQITKAVPNFNKTLAEYAVGNIIRLKDRPELVWKDLPLLVPYLHPVSERNRGYLHGGLFPVAPPTNAPPPQLFEQLTGPTNLVYYDWEITQQRLNQLRPLLELGSVVLTISPMSTNANGNRWLDAIEPRLGNTVTEATLISPQVVQIVRTSHLGLNGLELLSLANWIEGTNFPSMNLDFHFRPVVRTSRKTNR